MMRFPLIHQHDASDCGPAALTMVARYFGKRISIARIRELAGTDRQGTTLAGLVMAAEEIGFSAKGVRAAVDGLCQIALPAVAHWREASRNHFVVVYKIRGPHVYIADPARGRRKVTIAEFTASWTGVLLLLSELPEFQHIVATPSSFSRLCMLLHPYRRLFFDVFLAAVLMTILGLASSFFIQSLVDFVFVLGRKPALNWLSLGMLIVLLARAAFLGLRSCLLAHLSRKIDADTVMGFYRHLVGLPLSFFSSRGTGEILSRLNDAIKIRIALSITTLSVVVDSLFLATTTAIMSLMNWRVTLGALSFVPLVCVFAVTLNKSMKRHQRRAMEKAADVEAITIETITGIQTIKALRAEARSRIRTEARLEEMLEASFQSQVLATYACVVTTLVSGLSATALLWFGARQVFAGTMTVGQLMALNAMLGFFIAPLERLSSANQTIQDAIVATERLGELMDLKLEFKSQRGNALDRKIEGTVEFCGVSLGYGSRRPVLENVSLRIEAGECVGIVGNSGCGKTTLVNLLGRFFEQLSGDVFIDGIDIRDYTFDCLRREIGFVPQEIVLFDTSIAENIHISCPSATADEVRTAARAARVDEIAKRLPLGFDTVVGERGLSLSGGERQRVALARALLQDPSILVLDEPTSHLDRESEAAVEAVLNQRRGLRTTIVISHRPLHFDRIVDLGTFLGCNNNRIYS